MALTAGGAVAGAVSYNPATRVATFTPASALANGTSFTASVSTAVRDVAGNFLASTFTSSFTTAAPPDVTPPAVTGALPANRASEVSVTTTVRVTFSEPINPATLTASTFTVNEISSTGLLVAGARTYDAATNTAIFTASLPYKNHRNYTVTVTTGVSDISGNPLTSQYTSCFTPTAGAGVATTLSGLHWAGNDACIEVHWHIPIIQTGSALTLGTECLTDGNIFCNIAALSEAGRAVLGGATCRPTLLGLPRLCEVEVESLTGTVSGTSVTFTFTTDNGLTFTFNGAFAAGVDSWLTGTISGTTMPAVGINFERQP